MIKDNAVKSHNPQDIQLLASDPKTSIYLAASAGTGKTKVLSDRYLRLLMEGVEPKKILCLTFTNAAAAEMRKRIIDKIAYWSSCDEEVLEKELTSLQGEITSNLISKAKQLYSSFILDIDHIKIQTMHSFCIELLKRNSNYQNAYFSYDIMDQVNKTRLFNSAIEKVMSRAKDDNLLSDAIEKLMEFYDYDRLLEIVNSILSSKITFLKYLSKISDEQHLKEYIYQKHEADSNLSSDIIEQQAMILPEGILHIIPVLKAEGEKLGYAIEKTYKNFPQYKKLFLKPDGEAYTRLIRSAVAKKHPNIIDILQNEQNRIYQYNEEYKKYASAELCFFITILTKRVCEEFENIKISQQLFEYDDLIIKAIDLLLNADDSYWILYKLDLAIDHILVDEAQDLSETQWELIKLISEEFFSGVGAKEINRTIFMVGDIKQSIYSFQGASPEEFQASRKYFSHKVQNALKPWKEIHMTTSFRSTAPILKFIDDLLYTPLSTLAQYINHIPHRHGDGKIEILPLVSKSQNSKSTGWKIPKYEDQLQENPQRILAQEIAIKIQTWITEKRRLSGSLKVIEPKDIMILLKKRSDIMDYLIAELKERDIPVIDFQKTDLQDNLLIQDFTSLIKFINLQTDDYNLACLLKSPFIGIDEMELFNLCHGREGSLWERIELMMPSIYHHLQSFIDKSHHFSLLEFINHILYTDQYYTKFLAKYGDSAYDLIYLFLESIIKFENSGIIFSPYEEFIKWFHDYNADYVNIASQNKVQILTIHAAKGLQSPIVFLADSASSNQSPHQNIFWDKEGDLFFSAYSEYDCKQIKDIKNWYGIKQAEESYRLLYVALSRAEDELYICGWENNKLQGSWYELMSTLAALPPKS